MVENEKASVPVLAATMMILRDAPGGLEVFMVKRHHQIDFVAGALVFPGGKLDRGDSDEGLGEFADGAELWSAEMRATGAAAIRETFEESGILLARDADTGDMVSEARLAALDAYRAPIERGETRLVDLLRRERLRLAYDELVYFAHWITPPRMPKRFDTHFFVARAPVGHAGRHDGRESVESVWIRPLDAIADPQKWNVIFPTRLNLLKLAQSMTVAEALEKAGSAPPLTIEPWQEERPEGLFLCIRDDAGYTETSMPLRDLPWNGGPPPVNR